MNYLLSNICALCCVVALCAWQVSPAQSVKKYNGSVSRTERTIPVNSKWTSVLTSSLVNQQVRHWLFQQYHYQYINNKHKNWHWCHCNLNFFILQVRSMSVLGSGMCTVYLCTGCLTALRRDFAKMKADILWLAIHRNQHSRTRPHLLVPTRRRVGYWVTAFLSIAVLLSSLYGIGLHILHQRIYIFLDGSSLLGLSHISVNASMTVNDTALTNVTISRLEIPDPIDSLDLTICPADDILDGCKVSNGKYNIMNSALFLNKLVILTFVLQLYLCGLPTKKLEKLRRLVNATGGLRFNQPTEELTHVVMGDLDVDIRNFISKTTHRSALHIWCHSDLILNEYYLSITKNIQKVSFNSGVPLAILK